MRKLVLNITQADIDNADDHYNNNPVARCAKRMGYKGAYAGHRGWLVCPKPKEQVAPRYYPLRGDETMTTFLTDFINNIEVKPVVITLYLEGRK